MFRTSRSGGLGHIALAAVFFVSGTAYSSETLLVYDNEAEFLGDAPVVSTEDFDGLPSGGYSASEVVFDEVHYTIRTDWGPEWAAWCELEGYYCWWIRKTGDGMDASGTLVANGRAAGEGGNEWETVTLGDGNAVKAIGFYIRGGIQFESEPSVAWMHVKVEEIGGTATFFYLPSEPEEFVYLGLVSETGIVSVEIMNESPDVDPQYPASVYFSAFDDVSRSEIFTEYVHAAIDLKPWSDKNLVDPNSTRLIPVAILGHETFDALQCDLTSLRLGPGNARGRNYRVMDVNRDRNMDLLVYFRSRDLQVGCGISVVDLVGQAHDGTEMRGADSVTNMRCR